LRRVEHHGAPALGAAFGLVQRDCLLADTARVFHQLKVLDQLVAFVLILAAEGVGIRALLDLRSGESKRRKAGTGDIARLMNVRTFAGVEPLLVASEAHAALSERDAGDNEQLGIDPQEQIEVLLDGGAERIDAAGRSPIDLDGRLRRQAYGMFLDA